MSVETGTRPHPPTETPHAEFYKNGRLKIVLAGLDQNIRTHAIEAADAALNEQTSEAGFKGFLKRIWHGNLARKHYRAKYTREAEGSIRENKNLLHPEGMSDDDYRLQTTLRYASEFDDALIHRRAGETYTNLTTEHDTKPEAKRVKDAIFELIRQYAAGELDDSSFEQEKRRTMSQLSQEGVAKEYIGDGLIYADNLLQIAQNVKHATEHGEALDNLLGNADVVVGEAKIGVRTEVHRSRVERLTERLSSVPWLNEATIATAASVAYSVAGWAARSTASAATKVGIISPVAGAVSGIREAHVLRIERKQLSREIAQGKYAEADEDEAGDDSELSRRERRNRERNKQRRDELRETIYESKSARELIAQIGLLYDHDGKLRLDGSKASFDEAMFIVAEAQARIQLSDSEAIDLINFSSVGAIEKERLDLDVALAKAKCDIRAFLRDSPDSLAALGLDPADFDTKKQAWEKQGDKYDELDYLFEPYLYGSEGALGAYDQLQRGEEGIEAKDRIYNKLRNKRVAKAFVKGTLLGAGIGLAAQEVAALVTNQQGLTDRFILDTDQTSSHETLLASVGSEHEVVGNVPSLSGEHTTLTLSDGSKINFPSEFTVKAEGGLLTVDGPNGIHFDNLPLNEDGTLSAAAGEALNAGNFTINQEVDNIAREFTRQETVTGREFVSSHNDLAATVTRDFWYDNGTPSIFEGDELGLHWGGENGSGFDAEGNIVLDLSSMNDVDFSQTGDQLQVAVSASKDTQAEAFMIPVDASGRAIIEKDSPLASLFGNQDGQVVFRGGYIEAAEVAGQDADGVTHIRPLATVTGENSGSFTDTVTQRESVPVTNYTLEYNLQPEVQERLVAVPPVLPWYPRRGYGRAESAPAAPTAPPTPEEERRDAYYVSGYFEASPEQKQRFKERMSPRLQENPDADLNEEEELRWYWEHQSEEHRDRIDDLAESMGPMDDTIDVVVAIPVAGHQEAENIYRTLAAYKEQTLGKERFEIVLYVNHPETDKDGNPTSADATLAEIERFRQDNPDMPIKVLYEKLPRDQAKIGLIRKTLNDTILRRGMSRGSRPERDLVIVSNDADTVAMSNVYLQNFRDRLYSNPELDALVGQIDWDNEAYLLYPEVHVATRFFLYQDIMWRRMGGMANSSGATFAMRAKNMAAVGGYDPQSTIGEDTAIGFAFKTARDGTDRQPIGYGGNTQSRLQTSARRAVYTYEAYGDAPLNQWSYEFGADDDAVRRLIMSRTGVPNYDDPLVRQDVTARVEGLINKTLNTLLIDTPTTVSGATAGVNLGGEPRTVIERSLAFCGLKYEWAPDGRSIIIADASQMIEGLKAFAARNSGTEGVGTTGTGESTAEATPGPTTTPGAGTSPPPSSPPPPPPSSPPPPPSGATGAPGPTGSSYRGTPPPGPTPTPPGPTGPGAGAPSGPPPAAETAGNTASDAERAFMDSLGSDTRPYPAEYEFAGMRDQFTFTDTSNRRVNRPALTLAANFLRQAEGELGTPGNFADRLRIADRARTLAQTASAASPTGGQIEQAHRQALNILDQSASSLAQRASRETRANGSTDATELLRNLASETRAYPYRNWIAGRRGVDAFNPLAVNLATRLIYAASASVERRDGEPREQRRRRVVREALRRVNSLNNPLAEEATQLLTQSTATEQESRANPWETGYNGTPTRQ